MSAKEQPRGEDDWHGNAIPYSFESHVISASAFAHYESALLARRRTRLQPFHTCNYDDGVFIIIIGGVFVRQAACALT